MKEERILHKESRRGQKSKLRKNTSCFECMFYPCFKGMESIKSNLAETCVKYKR